MGCGSQKSTGVIQPQKGVIPMNPQGSRNHQQLQSQSNLNNHQQGKNLQYQNPNNFNQTPQPNKNLNQLNQNNKLDANRQRDKSPQNKLLARRASLDMSQQKLDFSLNNKRQSIYKDGSQPILNNNNSMQQFGNNQMNEPLNKKVTKDVVLYWSLQSAPSRALKSFMLNINKDLLFDEVPLDILRGDHKRSEILAINPKGQVPFLIYKKDLMVESASILRFLAQVVPSLKQFYPENPVIRQKIDAALDFNGTTLRPAVNQIIHIYFSAMKSGKSIGFELSTKIEQYLRKIHEQLQIFDQQLKRNGQKFIAGSTASIADFQLYFEIQSSELIITDMHKYLAISIWKQNCAQQKGMLEVGQSWKQVIFPNIKQQISVLQNGGKIEQSPLKQSRESESMYKSFKPSSNNIMSNSLKSLKTDNSLYKSQKF